MITQRIFKFDRWLKIYGSKIPAGALVTVIRFYPRRRVMVEYQGERILTMLWNLVKPQGVDEGRSPSRRKNIPLSFGEGAGGKETIA